MQAFRLALKSDEEAIYRLYDAVRAKGRLDGTSDWDEDYPNRKILEDDLRNDNLYVLEDNGRIISAVSMVDDDSPEMRPLSWEEGKSCCIVRLCVAPECQGKGVGEKMMRYISDAAREKGCRATHHTAPETNKAANMLYRRMGYRNLGKIYAYGMYFIAYEMIL